MSLCLFAAVAAVLAVLLSRRSLRDWQDHYTSENRLWKAQHEAGVVYQQVDVSEGDFQKIMEDSSHEGPGYLRAEEIAVPEDMKRWQGK